MLLRLSSFVLLPFFFFGCPACFKAFEQSTTLLYTYALISLVFMLLVNTSCFAITCASLSLLCWGMFFTHLGT